tara:strand:+ start:532 stop:1572 length:1041 start_codon:yes stop_codon:yes gene_type:complete
MAGAFVPTFFRSKGIDLSFIVLLSALAAIWSVVMFFLVSKFEMRTSLAIGHLCHACMFFSLVLLPTMIALVAYAILLGTTFIIFWIPLNTIFFRSSQRQTNAIDSAIYFLTGGLLAVIMPPLGGYIITDFGYTWFFSIVAGLYLIMALIVWIKVEKEKIIALSRVCITDYKKLKTITFLDGSFHFFKASIIPIYTLLFITTEKNFGWFLGYLGLIGFIIAIFLSYKSDKKQKRISYIMFLFILMSLSTLSLVLAENISVWIILVGIFTVIYNISSPFRVAVTMDAKKVDLQFWKSRELFLNLGRSVFLSVAFVFFYLKIYWPLFVFYAMLIFIFPLFVKYKLKELN